MSVLVKSECGLSRPVQPYTYKLTPQAGLGYCTNLRTGKAARETIYVTGFEAKGWARLPLPLPDDHSGILLPAWKRIEI
jgi:hypothetical protein